MRFTLIVILLAFSFSCLASQATADTLVDKYLAEGELAAGEKAMLQHLQENPKDDQARFGLGVLQTLQAVQRLSNNVFEAGIRSELFMNGPPRDKFEKMVFDLFKHVRKPKKLTYAGFRNIFQTFVDDLDKTDATLAKIKDANVKLPFHPGKVQLTPFSGNTRFRIGAIGVMFQNPLLNRAIGADAQIVFDRGDVSWLRGYCNALAGFGEVFLAVDSKQLFDVAAHRVFENVDTPHKFLLEEPQNAGGGPFWPWDYYQILDAIAAIHSTHFPMKEPARMKKALQHFETTLAMAKKMWTHYLAEQDDDHEWIPNPKQKGVLGIPVTQERLDAWLATLAEAERVLQGKKLLPFWRGTKNKRGINLRKVFTQPRDLDVILWIQGAAATPFLEDGTITEFADVQRFDRLNRVFGGAFFGFGLWFN